MGYKKVCFNCRKAFNIDIYEREKDNLICPNCGNVVTIFNHKFRPPKTSDLDSWKVVEFLKNNGFIYQHVFQGNKKEGFTEAPYPENMLDAKEFVQKFKAQAMQPGNTN